ARHPPASRSCAAEPVLRQAPRLARARHAPQRAPGAPDPSRPCVSTMITCPVTGTQIRLGPTPSFFEGGFRPFFLMAALYSALSILAWVPLVHGHYMIE